MIVDACFLLALVPPFLRRRIRPADLGLRKAPGARSVGVAVLLLFVYLWGALTWLRAVHPRRSPNYLATIGHHSTLYIVFTGLAAILTVPVMEEVFFRGFLYRSLRNRVSVLPACLIAGVLFGIGHTQYPLLERGVQTWFGITTALTYEWTGSLLPAIAIHSLIDGGDFESALTGNRSIYAIVYLLIAVVLLVRPPLKAVWRRISSPAARPELDQERRERASRGRRRGHRLAKTLG